MQPCRYKSSIHRKSCTSLPRCRGSGRITALSGQLPGTAKKARGNRSLCHPRYRGSGHARSFDLRMWLCALCRSAWTLTLGFGRQNFRTTHQIPSHQNHIRLGIFGFATKNCRVNWHWTVTRFNFRLFGRTVFITPNSKCSLLRTLCSKLGDVRAIHYHCSEVSIFEGLSIGAISLAFYLFIYVLSILYSIQIISLLFYIGAISPSVYMGAVSPFIYTEANPPTYFLCGLSFFLFIWTVLLNIYMGCLLCLYRSFPLSLFLFIWTFCSTNTAIIKLILEHILRIKSLT